MEEVGKSTPKACNIPFQSSNAEDDAKAKAIIDEQLLSLEPLLYLKQQFPAVLLKETINYTILAPRQLSLEFWEKNFY